MKFKKGVEPVTTSEVYYDLFDGGYLDPDKFLEDEKELEEVNKALETVMTYISELEDIGLLEYN